MHWYFVYIHPVNTIICPSRLVSPSFFFSPGFSRHKVVHHFSSRVGSRISILFSDVLSSFSVIYIFSTLSSMCVVPHHMCPGLIFLEAWQLPMSRMCSFPILSLRVHLHIRSILISFTSTRFLSRLV